MRKYYNNRNRFAVYLHGHGRLTVYLRFFDSMLRFRVSIFSEFYYKHNITRYKSRGEKSPERIPYRCVVPLKIVHLNESIKYRSMNKMINIRNEASR